MHSTNNYRFCLNYFLKRYTLTYIYIRIFVWFDCFFFFLSVHFELTKSLHTISCGGSASVFFSDASKSNSDLIKLFSICHHHFIEKWKKSEGERDVEKTIERKKNTISINRVFRRSVNNTANALALSVSSFSCRTLPMKNQSIWWFIHLMEVLGHGVCVCVYVRVDNIRHIVCDDSD